MGWRPCVALQIAEQTSAPELLLGYSKLRLTHSHFVRVKILINPSDSGIAGPPLHMRRPLLPYYP